MHTPPKPPIYKVKTDRTEREIDSSTIIVGVFNTFYTVDIWFRQKIIKETAHEHYRPHRPNRHMQKLSPNYIRIQFFSSTHRTFSRGDHLLGYKMSLNKFKKIKIIPNILSE